MVRVVRSPVGVGRTMGRSRYQQGTIRLVGKRVKSWRGRWHSYTVDADGVEHRHNHTQTLGMKSEMTKDAASVPPRLEVENALFR